MPESAHQEHTRWLGPVFFWEVVRASRRGVWHVGRFVFAAGLLVYLCMEVGQMELRPSQLSLMSEWLAGMYYAVQRLAVVLLTPALVAGSMLDERNKRTLPLLLASMLSPQEIVSGKLAGRLLGLVTVLVTGLPFLALLQFLGGIDFLQVLWQLLIAVMIMLFLAMNSMTMSCHARTLTGAVTKTYLRSAQHFLFGWLLTLPFSTLLTREWSVSFFAASGVMSLWLAVVFAAVSLRRLVLQLPEIVLNSHLPDNRVLATERAWLDLSQMVWSLKSMMGTPRDAWEYRFQARESKREYQDGDVAIRYNRIPDVASWSMVWKDRYFPFDRQTAFFLSAGSLIVGAITFLVLVSMAATQRTSEGVETPLRGMAYLGMELVISMLALRSSACIGEEIQQRTLESLLTTPWRAWQFIGQKMIAVGLRYRLLILIVGGLIIPLVAWRLDGPTFWIVPVFAAQCVFVICLGTWLSLICGQRVALARALMVILVFLSLTVLPFAIKRCSQWVKPVMLHPDPWAVSWEREQSKTKRQIALVRELPPSTPSLDVTWLHVAQVGREILCPLEAWHDILNVRYYWVPTARPVVFASAMETNSPGWIHGASIVVLLTLSAGMFGWGSLWLRRVRYQ